MSSSRTVYFFFLAGVVFWCVLIPIAPVAKQSGLFTPLSTLLYDVFSHVCHQFKDRSFSIGSEPFAVCIRCTAIYFGFLFGLALFPFIKGLNRPTVPSRALFILALAPMAVDVLLAFLDIHASTAATRIATGSLAGLILPFFSFPPLFDALCQFRLIPGDNSHAGKTK